MPPNATTSIPTTANGSTNSMDIDKDIRAPITTADNYMNDEFVPPSTNEYMSVYSPTDSTNEIGKVAVSGCEDVNQAVECASEAFASWSSLTMKSRAAIMLKFHSLIKAHADELSDLIVLENGKNKTEALADVAKGNETVEYACSLPQVAQGKILGVSSGNIFCRDEKRPLGVCVSIVPFNFPFMVPMWTIPIALVLGNTFVLKPSEKVPLTMLRVASLLKEAGLPKGVFNMVNGTKDAVEALIDHPSVSAVTFVGSSPIAKIVSTRCRALHKKCTALGGAKNHLIALPDCDVESASSDIVVSFAGCAGQRCMAASVLLTVEGKNDSEKKHQEKLLQKIIEKASKIQPGTKPGQMGPVIDQISHTRIMNYIDQAQSKHGAKILLDGRTWSSSMGGSWIGPTIILHSSPQDTLMKEEAFGPVLSIYSPKTWNECIQIENGNPFGNAACVYTQNGGKADWFCQRFRASMLGVNIGIPVPREPFSFGGLYGTLSKYGDLDITGDNAIEFFTNRIKITTKWVISDLEEDEEEKEAVSKDEPNAKKQKQESKVVVDHANFAGRM